jgi:hypothetical protein
MTPTGITRHRGHHTEGLRAVSGIDRGSSLRSHAHAGFHKGMPDDDATGRVHNEGVGVLE